MCSKARIVLSAAVFSVALILGCPSTFAARTSVVRYKAVLRAAESSTRERLLDLLIPGVANGTVELRKPFRHVFFSENNEDGYIGKVKLGSANLVRMRCGGHPRMALLATFSAEDDNELLNGELTILAVFNMESGKPKLIDAADVSGDRFVCLAAPATVSYQTGSDAVIIDNNHFNSNENYTWLQPVALVNNRLVDLCRGVPPLVSGHIGTSALKLDGRYVAGRPNGNILYPLFFKVQATVEKFSEDEPDKVIASESKIFSIPMHPKGKVYSVNSKDKSLKALNAFIKKSGFSEP